MRKIVREVALLLLLTALLAGAIWVYTHRQGLLHPQGALVHALAQPSPQLAWSPPTFTGEPNRVVPAHSPLEQKPVLPAVPTDEQIAGSRILPNRLWPTGGGDTAKANAEVAALLAGLSDRPARELYDAIERWLPGHRDSRWFHALQTELMNHKWSLGYFDEARTGWTDTWNALKQSQEIDSYHLANDVLAKLLDANIGFARADTLRTLVDETANRPLNGALDGKLFRAREAVWLLEHTAAQNVMCGPMALNAIKDFNHEPYLAPRMSQVAPEFQSTGLSLAEVRRYAENDYKLPMTAAQRTDAGTSIPVPAVMHVKDNHFNALLAVSPDGSQYFLEDRTQNFAKWVDKAAVDKMSSGYFLLAKADLPKGWNGVSGEAANKIYGRDGAHGTIPPDQSTTNDHPKTDDDDPCKKKGMPRYTFHPMPGAIRIGDIPLQYKPPVGPTISFKINYNDLDSGAPTSPPTWSNVGLTWSTDWVAWIEHVGGTLTNGTGLRVRLPGGGTEVDKYDSTVSRFGPNDHSFALVTRTGTYTYTRELPDGSRQVYNSPDNSANPYRIFLSEIYDPQGNKLTLTYDGNVRLVAVTDAIGQVTTLSYTDSSSIYRITKVTDPFGRFGSLSYDSGGRLISVTDQLGLTSTFTYGLSGFIATMVTPYGTTTFSNPTNNVGSNRIVEVVDPLGWKERVEFNDTGSTYVPSLQQPPTTVMVGGEAVPFYAENTRLQFRNAYYWDKLASQVAPGDYKAARNYRFFTDANYQVVPVVEAVKNPDEDREWVNYPGGLSNYYYPYYTGASAAPEKRLRVLADGTTQLRQSFTNALGLVAKVVDPLGRTSEYTYAANGEDLLEIRQTTGGISERILTFTYNTQHRPLTIVDAAGQTTTYAYNTRGQTTSVTNPKSEVTAFTYDANGYLTKIDGPLAGAGDVSTFTYDAVGRVKTTTDRDGYVRTYTYDTFDRIVKIDYPDATSETMTFDRLDIVGQKDRLGHATTYVYDANRQLIQVTDPLARVTKMTWCRCGSLSSVTDPAGHVTRWQRDLEGRVTAKIFADNSKVTFAYDSSSGRLQRRTDEKGQFKEMDYFVDDSIRQIRYPNAQVPTPSVNYTYDTKYLRMTSMTDGIGTTRYSYIPISGTATPGAGQLGAMDGPYENSAFTYGYDALGRAISRTYNGLASSLTLDALGRTTLEKDPLGSFSFQYDGATQRKLNMTRPNGVTTAFSYGDIAHDRRLQRIKHVRISDSKVLSQFDYTQDATGRILTWAQSQDGQVSETWNVSYDAADQLTGVNIARPGVAAAVDTYTYDVAGNRQSKAQDSAVTAYAYNALNELANAGGSLPASTFQWDAENRLVSVKMGNDSIAFSYDGVGRCRRIRQASGTTVSSDLTYIWDKGSRVEERDAAGTPVRRFWWRGYQTLSATGTATPYFFTNDHLGSVREVLDGAGAVAERLNYGPYGEPVGAAPNLSPFSYGGQWVLPKVGLIMANYRFYSPDQGRWISRDPIGGNGGLNLFAYVRSNPVNERDPWGLFGWDNLWEGLDDSLTVGPIDTYRAKQIADQALKDAENSGLPGLHNGPADAYRHCLWSCRMAKELGKDQAKDLGDNHEKHGKGPKGETCMDLHNNKQGRDASDKDDCDKACRQLLQDGKLQTSPGGDPETPGYSNTPLYGRDRYYY